MFKNRNSINFKQFVEESHSVELVRRLLPSHAFKIDGRWVRFQSSSEVKSMKPPSVGGGLSPLLNVDQCSMNSCLSSRPFVDDVAESAFSVLMRLNGVCMCASIWSLMASCDAVLKSHKWQPKSVWLMITDANISSRFRRFGVASAFSLRSWNNIINGVRSVFRTGWKSIGTYTVVAGTFAQMTGSIRLRHVRVVATVAKEYFPSMRSRKVVLNISQIPQTELAFEAIPFLGEFHQFAFSPGGIRFCRWTSDGWHAILIGRIRCWVRWAGQANTARLIECSLGRSLLLLHHVDAGVFRLGLRWCWRVRWRLRYTCLDIALGLGCLVGRLSLRMRFGEMNVQTGAVLEIHFTDVADVAEVQMLLLVMFDWQLIRREPAFAHQTFLAVHQNVVYFAFTRLPNWDRKTNKWVSSKQWATEFRNKQSCWHPDFTSFLSSAGQLGACFCNARRVANGMVHHGHVKNSFGCALMQCTCSNAIESDEYVHGGHGHLEFILSEFTLWWLNKRIEVKQQWKIHCKSH